jgi:hypothetical protein
MKITVTHSTVHHCDFLAFDTQITPTPCGTKVAGSYSGGSPSQMKASLSLQVEDAG